MRSRAFLTALFTLLTATAWTQTTSSTGTFTADTDTKQIAFTLPSTSAVTIKTLGYAGGVNANSTTIPRGGFDPAIAIFDATGNFVAANNDGGCSKVSADSVTKNCLDAYIAITLAAGNYTLALTVAPNFAAGPTLADGFVYSGQSGFTAVLCGPGGAAPFCDPSPSQRNGNWAVDISITAHTQVASPATTITAGSVQGTAGSAVNIPLTLAATTSGPADSLVFTVTLIAAAGSQPLSSIAYTPAGGLPASSVMSSAPNAITIMFNGAFALASNSSTPLGNLAVNLPSAGDGDSYVIHVSGGSGVNGTATFIVQSGADGQLTEPYRTYLVGDIFPSTADTFGQFGDQAVNTVDLLAVLRAVAAVPGSVPAKNSARFDAMDTFPVDGANRGGDCILNTLDLLAELRRASGVDTTRPRRLPQPGTCPTAAPEARVRASIQLEAGDAEATSSGWRVPVYLVAQQGATLDGLAFSLENSTPLVWQAANAASPTLQDNSVAGYLALAWLAPLNLPRGTPLLLGYATGTAAPPRLRIRGESAHDNQKQVVELQTKDRR